MACGGSSIAVKAGNPRLRPQCHRPGHNPPMLSARSNLLRVVPHGRDAMSHRHPVAAMAGPSTPADCFDQQGERALLPPLRVSTGLSLAAFLPPRGGRQCISRFIARTGHAPRLCCIGKARRRQAASSPRHALHFAKPAAGMLLNGTHLMLIICRPHASHAGVKGLPKGGSVGCGRQVISNSGHIDYIVSRMCWR